MPALAPRLLLIDDDQQLRQLLTRRLVDAGYRLTAMHFGQDGYAEAVREAFDLVILDLSLPDIDGIAVIHELRARSQVFVLVLSGRNSEFDKIAAFDAGADDFLGKPFSFAELEARIRAALRRGRRTDGSPGEQLDLDGLHIDFARRIVEVDGRQVHLSPIEFRLLALLVEQHGCVVAHEAMLSAVWGPDQVHQLHYLRVQMSNLRKKIEPDPMHPRYVLTEPTIGYRFGLR